MTGTLEGPRGIRGGAAIAAAVASVVALWTLSSTGLGVSGGGERTLTDGLTVEYTYGGDRPLDLTATMIAVALAAAAIALWAARDRRLLLAAWVACVIAVGATTARAVDQRSAGMVTSSEIRALETGMSRTAVLDRLGEPAGAATASGPGSAGLDCVVYLRRTDEGHEVHPLCFRAGRLTLAELRS